MFSSQDMSRSVARIVQKYDGGSPKGRFADQDYFGDGAGLPPASVLRVADPNAGPQSPPRLARARERPATVPEPQMPHEWQYTLAKPVSVRSSRAEAGRTRADAHAAMRDSAAVLGSLSYQSSADLRTGWKGKKLSAQAANRRKGGRYPKRQHSAPAVSPPSHNALTPTVKILRSVGENELGPWDMEGPEHAPYAPAQEEDNEGEDGRPGNPELRRVPIPRDPYAHVESVLVRSGLIPHVSPHTAAVYAALPASERNTHQNEARRMLRDTMHPVRQERHPHQVAQVTMSVLSDKVWVMDKLGEYSKEVEKQVEVLKDSPAHMYQWMADTREKQAEIQRHTESKVNHKTPHKAFGPNGQRRMAPPRGRGVRTQSEATQRIVAHEEGHTSVHAVLDNMGRVQDHLDRRASEGGAVAAAPSAHLAARPAPPRPGESRNPPALALPRDDARHPHSRSPSRSPMRGTRQGGGAGVLEKAELEARLVEYFHGNTALAHDCLKAVWKGAQPLSPTSAAHRHETPASTAPGDATLSSFLWAGGSGSWQVVAEPDGAGGFPGTRPSTTQGSLRPQPSQAPTPSPLSPGHGLLDFGPVVPGSVGGGLRTGTPVTSYRPPSTAPAGLSRDGLAGDGQQHPHGPLEPSHWHHVLFPASQPALKRNLELTEDWVATMVYLLDIKLAARTHLPAGAAHEPGGAEHDPTSATLSSDFEALFLVYAVAYLEIVRQVTVQSAPRGEFMLRIWHSMCRMIAGILYSVDQQLQGQDDRVKRSYRDGFVKGQVEGSSSHGQWKAKFSVTSQKLEALKEEYGSEKARLEGELHAMDSELKQTQAELDALRMRLADDPAQARSMPSTPTKMGGKARQRLRDQLTASTEEGLRNALSGELSTGGAA